MREEQVKVLFLIVLSIFLLVFNINSISKKEVVETTEKELPKISINPTTYLKPKKNTQSEKIPSIVTNKTIYLTFDDGPSYLTDQILDILKEENVPATFFVIGTSIDTYKNTVKRAYNDGHQIAIHTYCHKYDQIYTSDENFMNDFREINNKIYEITGHHAFITRFPGGSSNVVSKKYNPGIMTRLADNLQKAGYHYFDWNVDSGDASGSLTKEQIYENVTKHLQYETNVVLMHDAAAKKTTVEALRNIIKYGKNNHYTFAKITKKTPSIKHNINN